MFNESMPVDIDIDRTITSRSSTTRSDQSTLLEAISFPDIMAGAATTYPEMLPTNLPLLASIIHPNISDGSNVSSYHSHSDADGGGVSKGSNGNLTIGQPIKFSSSSSQNLPASMSTTTAIGGTGISRSSVSASSSSGKLSSLSTSVKSQQNPNSAMLNYIYDSYAPNRHKHYDFR